MVGLGSTCDRGGTHTKTSRGREKIVKKKREQPAKMYPPSPSSSCAPNELCHCDAERGDEWVPAFVARGPEGEGQEPIKKQKEALPLKRAPKGPI